MSTISSQRGVGLIEVMVTVLILSTSLLGLAALQNRSLQYNHSAYLRSQANILAYDLLDRVRINRKNVSSYSLAIDAATPSGSILASQDLNQWRTTLGNALPGGTGGVTCDINRICTVTIRWQEQEGTDADDNDPDTQPTTTFTYTSRV